jgi:hypothetical protein
MPILYRIDAKIRTIRSLYSRLVLCAASIASGVRTRNLDVEAFRLRIWRFTGRLDPLNAEDAEADPKIRSSVRAVAAFGGRSPRASLYAR